MRLFVFFFFFKYLKMSKYISDKYYQKNKDYKKNFVKNIKVFLKKKKKSNNMVVNITKISYRMKNKKFVQYRKKHYRMTKNVLL